MFAIALRTVVPIILLIGSGFLARRQSILRAGDERVLAQYLYYFALPALLLVNMAETTFNAETLRFVLAMNVPVLVATTLYLLVYFIFRFKRDLLYLLIVATVFGSMAFFGIPFIIFAFPTALGERFAILSASSVSVLAVALSITSLEMYKLNREGKAGLAKGVGIVVRRLVKNPLILAIAGGVVVSLLGLKLPLPISGMLHMLGRTTAGVALFMLGVALYGKKYSNLLPGFGLSLLRIIFLPLIAFLVVRVLGFTGIPASVLVLQNAMPVAVSIFVLSERYDFYKETIASLILFSSLGAVIYLNIWLWLVG